MRSAGELLLLWAEQCNLQSGSRPLKDELRVSWLPDLLRNILNSETLKVKIKLNTRKPGNSALYLNNVEQQALHHI